MKNTGGSGRDDESVESEEDDWIHACTNHSDLAGFQELDGTYYSDSFLKSKEVWPRRCGDCDVLFISGRPATRIGAEYKVTLKNTVMACPMALRGNCKCCFALCKPCMNKATITFEEETEDKENNKRKGNAPTRSSKRPRRLQWSN